MECYGRMYNRLDQCRKCTLSKYCSQAADPPLLTDNAPPPLVNQTILAYGQPSRTNRFQAMEQDRRYTRADLLEVIVASKPDIIGHNIETVERLTPVVRSRAKYRTSLETLRCLNRQGVVTKSGLMVGLGESDDEVLQTLHDLRDAGVRIVALGQYLRPTLEHYPVAAYITPEKFEWYRLKALEMGFSYCASAPLVRSSYMAEEALKSVKSL